MWWEKEGHKSWSILERERDARHRDVCFHRIAGPSGTSYGPVWIFRWYAVVFFLSSRRVKNARVSRFRRKSSSSHVTQKWRSRSGRITEASPIARISLYFRLSLFRHVVSLVTTRFITPRSCFQLTGVWYQPFYLKTNVKCLIIDATRLTRRSASLDVKILYHTALTPWRWYKSSKRNIRVECPFLCKTPYIFPSRSRSRYHLSFSISSLWTTVCCLFLPPSRSLLFLCQQAPLLSFSLLQHTTVLPSSLQLGSSVSLWPALPLWPTRRATQCFSAETEVWQHRESGCASRSLDPRGGDCGKILMPLTTVLNRRRPGTSSRAQTSCFHAPGEFHRLGEKRIIRASRENPSTTNGNGSAKLRLPSTSLQVYTAENWVEILAIFERRRRARNREEWLKMKTRNFRF